MPHGNAAKTVYQITDKQIEQLAEAIATKLHEKRAPRIPEKGRLAFLALLAAAAISLGLTEIGRNLLDGMSGVVAVTALVVFTMRS